MQSTRIHIVRSLLAFELIWLLFNFFAANVYESQNGLTQHTSVVSLQGSKATFISGLSRSGWALGMPEEIFEVSQEKEEEDTGSKKGFYFSTVIPSYAYRCVAGSNLSGTVILRASTPFQMAKAYLSLRVFRL